MGVLSASPMERSEPSLAPQWLKSVGGLAFQGGTANSNQQQQRYSPRQQQTNGFASGDRLQERETASSFRSYSNFGGRGRLTERPERGGREWEWSKERRVGDKERFARNGDDKDRGERGFALYRPVPSRLPQPGLSGGGLHKSERSLPLAPKPLSVVSPRPLWPKADPEAADNRLLSSELDPGRASQGIASKRNANLKATDIVNLRLAPAATPSAAQRATSINNKATKLLVLKPSTKDASGNPSPNGTTKQLVDRRAVPIPVDASASPRPKNGLVANEDRKPSVLGQNRSDFFNAIRKNSIANGESRVAQEGSSPTGTEASKPDGDKPHEAAALSSKPAEVDDAKAVETTAAGARNGVFDKFMAEEEETAFLKSLGWEERDEDPLTEEEINAFFQEHMRCLTNSPSILSRQNRRLKSALMDANGGNTMLSPSSSSSDSEGEACAATS